MEYGVLNCFPCVKRAGCALFHADIHTWHRCDVFSLFSPDNYTHTISSSHADNDNNHNKTKITLSLVVAISNLSRCQRLILLIFIIVVSLVALIGAISTTWFSLLSLFSPPSTTSIRPFIVQSIPVKLRQ